MNEYDWSYLDVAELSWDLDDELATPAWSDVERVLDELAGGTSDRAVSLRLDDEGSASRPPVLIVWRSGDGFDITFASEEIELWPGEDTYDLANMKRIVKLFYDEQRLDDGDGWQPA